MLKLTLAIILLAFIVLFTTGFIGFTLKSIFQPRKRAPYIGTFKRHFKLLKKLNIKKNTKLLDLGCGDGKALRFFDKIYNFKKLDGYDINPYAIIRGKILNILKGEKHISLSHKNFLEINIKGYDYIYIYLGTQQLIDIEKRIRTNKDKKTILISNSFVFPNYKPFKIIKDSKGKGAIFLYK